MGEGGGKKKRERELGSFYISSLFYIICIVYMISFTGFSSQNLAYWGESKAGFDGLNIGGQMGLFRFGQYGRSSFP